MQRPTVISFGSLESALDRTLDRLQAAIEEAFEGPEKDKIWRTWTRRERASFLTVFLLGHFAIVLQPILHLAFWFLVVVSVSVRFPL